MDLKEFTHKFTTKRFNKEKHTSPENIDKAHNALIRYHLDTNPDEIVVIPMEEMAELTQHLSKILRKKEPCDNSNLGLIEEMADVQLCLDNLKRHFNISDDDIAYAMDIKIKRTLSKDLYKKYM